MFSEFIDASSWSHEQWLTISIMAFIVLAIFVVIHRMLRIFRMTQKKSYQPNLRPLRRRLRSENHETAGGELRD
ncbi:MAG TPA: hypothetical protein EYG31_03940 [Porticoccaceae bacterium]|nr:hypothetical protein [Porticoccaceae bacterium]